MDSFILRMTKNIISEEINERLKNVQNKIIENNKMKKTFCEECGGKTNEGDTCEECGSTYETDIQELGGMDDGHPRFGKKRLPTKMSIEDIEKLLRGDDDDSDMDDMDTDMYDMDDDMDDDDMDVDMDDDDMDDNLNENFFKKFIDRLKGKTPKKIEKSEYDGLTDEQAKRLYNDADKIFKNELNNTSNNDNVSAFYRLSIANDTMKGLKRHFPNIDFNDNKSNNDVENKLEEGFDDFEIKRSRKNIDYTKKEFPTRNRFDIKKEKMRRDDSSLYRDNDNEDEFEFELDETFNDDRKKIDKAKPYGKITPADFEALRSMKKEVEETLYELDLEEDDVEEGNAFSGALNLARKKGFKTFKVGNKTYPVDESFIFETDENYSKMSTNEIDELIKKIKKRNSEFKRLGKPIPDSSKEKLNQLYLTKKRKNKLDESRILFTETEVINLIENIVLEEKRKKTNNADNYLKSSLNQSKKQSEEYIDSVVQKMKGYLKNGSKGKYDMNPKGFPKGNGELETMSKMAYIPSKSVEEYVTNLTAAGLENIDYDEIHPDEDWVTDLMVGSSRTGNNPKWANSVETPTNKIRNKVRTDNYLSKIKKKAYNKAPQPIVKDKSGNDKGSGDFLSKLESVENRNIITDLEKMKNLITYGKKTQ